jgi:chromatin segregation and condensation protein Rec8/ScpA/Scc1 (kleisin family)/tRNA nucleotidyltransferase/poly(A) polymerase
MKVNGDSLLAAMTAEDVELLRSLGRIADARGTTACVVGGVVRDLILGRPVSDLDVVVEESAIDFGEAASSELGGSVKAHTRFGTVIFVTGEGRKVDIATARSEVYERPGALPTVTAGAIADDLRRRDFTINSMAIGVNAHGFGTLIDPHGGRADLDTRVLRVLTDGSFEDDPTRVLRGIRFAARFDMDFEERTSELLKRAVAERRTDSVSGERLMNELVLILEEAEPAAPVARLIEWGVLESIHAAWVVPPETAETVAEMARALVEPDEEGRAGRDAEGAPGQGDGGRGTSAGLLLALLRPVGPAGRVDILERLAAGRRVRSLARELEAFESVVAPALKDTGEVSRSTIYGALRPFSRETLLLAQALSRGTPAAERLALYMSELRATEVVLTGSDLAEMGVPEGTAVGDILSRLLDARLDGAVSNAEEERALASELVQDLTRSAADDSVSGRDGSNPGSGEATDVHQDEQKELTVGRDLGPDEVPAAEAGPPDGRAPDAAEDGPEAGDAEDTQTLVKRPVYEVRLEAFEGPLDLLLHLIREHEIDIYDIPIAQITEQYLEYIGLMESLDLALAGEFLEMAATLIRIKVQMLLPKDTGDEEEEDPREQLVRKLVEYKQFKEAAKTLSEKEQERRDYFPKGVDPRSYADLEEEGIDIEEFLRDVTLFDLVDGLREVLARVPERVEVHSVDMEEVTVEEQIDRIRAIVRERGSVPFTEIFTGGASRFQIVATFIALLELIRLGDVRATQKRNFAEIEITARVED